MKKTFDEICNGILNEDNVGGSTGVKNPTTSTTVANPQLNTGTATKPPTPPTAQKPADATNSSTQPNPSKFNPEDVLRALTQIDPNHPELHEFLDKVSKAVGDKQKQSEYNKTAQQGQTTNANQPA